MSGGRERRRERKRGYTCMATIKLAVLESIMVRYVMGGVSCNKTDQRNLSLKALKFKDTQLLHWGEPTFNYL